MTAEHVIQALEKVPFIPLRLHLASGKTMMIRYPGTAWVQQNTLLIVHPLSAGTRLISHYEVFALRLIERMEQMGNSHRPKSSKNGGRRHS